jgi:membrane glycosyltransferase
LSTPEETVVPQVLQRHRHLLSVPPLKELTDLDGIFRRILADPAFVALHRSVLIATDAARPSEVRQLRLAERQLIAGGPARVSIENRKAILSDPDALQSLHLFAWTRTRKGAS